MTQNIYDLSQLKSYLKQYPKASNSDLYSLCGATTESQKSSVRTKKTRLKNKKNDAPVKTQKKILTGSDLEITSLTPESVEKLIKDKLNKKSNIPDTQIRMALDYLIKLKITSEEGTDELDMEAFLTHELSERQE